MRIEGVVYLFCVKGRRSRDDFDGLYKNDSHLIYGWKRIGADADGDDWSWKYAWSDEAEVNTKTGKPVQRRLGKGWVKVPIFRDYPGGVKQWIADLGSRKINPRHLDPFESIFPQSMPVERRVDEVDSWRRQVVTQEMEVAAKVQQIGAFSTHEAYRKALDEHFPQYSHSCYSYNSPCPFEPVCWQGARAEVGDLYTIRIPNHVEKGDRDE